MYNRAWGFLRCLIQWKLGCSTRVWLMSSRPRASANPGICNLFSKQYQWTVLPESSSRLSGAYVCSILAKSTIVLKPIQWNIYKYSFSLNCYMGLAQASDNFNQGQSGPSPIKKLSALIYVALEFDHFYWLIKVTWPFSQPIRGLEFQLSINLLWKYFYRIRSRVSPARPSSLRGTWRRRARLRSPAATAKPWWSSSSPPASSGPSRWREPQGSSAGARIGSKFISWCWMRY